MKRRDARWIGAAGLIALCGAGLVLASLMVLATGNRSDHERHFPWLLAVNLGIAGLLASVIVFTAYRLIQRLRRGRFGSRLLLRLAGIFALVGVVPGAFVYTVSYQFVSRSIESWFDVSVERALDAGLDLGRISLDALVNDLAGQSRQAAERLGEMPERQLPAALERSREQLAAQELALLGPGGQVLASVGGGLAALGPERPATAQFRRAREGRVTAWIEGLDEDPGAARGAPSTPPRIRALASMPVAGYALAGEERWLLVTQWLPSQLAANALAVQVAYREYQQRALAREGLRRMYIGTLSLALALAVFGAVLLAATFGNRLAKPLLVLADGVQQVARGDLGPKPVFGSGDELGGLTRAFADMTRLLADARGQAEVSTAALEDERKRLQSILDTMSAGVLAFDAEARIDTVNPGASRILGLPVDSLLGAPLQAVAPLADFAAALDQGFAAHADLGEGGHWQDSIELRPVARGGPATRSGEGPAVEGSTLTLLVRGTRLPEGARLVVFDDITALVSAQRSQAWGEVARRLAHEIKNPLTPIQLSAERLAHRLGPKLVEADASLLKRAVGTIVDQVQAMKQLVNEFRDYARLPAAQLMPLDLNGLVLDLMQLYQGPQDEGRLSLSLAEGLPRIEGDSPQLRQVVHNLVQNALDATAELAAGHVSLRTEGRREADGRWHSVRLIVEDNGPGFAEGVLQRAFEPYVTTKSKGTGLGLAVVKKICDEHGARVRIGPREPGPAGSQAPPPVDGRPGARVSISFSKCHA